MLNDNSVWYELMNECLRIILCDKHKPNETYFLEFTKDCYFGGDIKVCHVANQIVMIT